MPGMPRIVLALACLLPAVAAAASLEAGLLALQQDWARVYYDAPTREAQARGFERLAGDADALARRHPQRGEPLVWAAIVSSCHAGVARGREALKLARTARGQFEEALRLGPGTLQATAYAGLGALYYRVPGFPLAFGDDDEAGEWLAKAIALDPDGLDVNFFYAEWLAKRGRYRQALARLEHAARVPPRPGLEHADLGRQREVAALRARVQGELD